MAARRTAGRKILYFLGAGASVAAGAYATVQAGGRLPIPTQATFWDTFLRFCEGRNNRRTIESFLFRYFLGYNRVPSRTSPAERRAQLNVVDVEEVFTFLSERVRAPSTSAQLRAYARDVWEALVTEVRPVFSRFPPNQQTRQMFRAFLRNHVRSYDAVVSFNYDTVFEQSLPHNHAWAYEALEDATGCLRILKPHGSINWEAGNPIERVREATRSVIVAPTHLKFVATAQPKETPELAGYLDQSPQIQEVWARMEEHMRDARILVFIGYSFPVGDLYFSSILRSVLALRDNAPGIVLVNPDAVALADRLQARFAIPQIARYFDFSQFIQASRRNVLSQFH